MVRRSRNAKGPIMSHLHVTEWLPVHTNAGKSSHGINLTNEQWTEKEFESLQKRDGLGTLELCREMMDGVEYISIKRKG